MTTASIRSRFFDLAQLSEKPVVQKEKSTPEPSLPLQKLADNWITQFNHAIQSKNAEATEKLFQPEAWWRDILATSWDFHLYQSAKVIAETITERNSEAGITEFRFDTNGPLEQVTLAPSIGKCVCFFVLFETKVGRGRGVVFLSPTDDSGQEWKAFILYTSLQELKGYEEKKGATRPRGVDHGQHINRKTWLDKRIELQNMQGLEPVVLVIGAGHSGLNIAARLGMLDILTLVIDKNERVGDNWRKRYKSLVLHDPVWYDHLSYIPFPPNWPIFTPKDKLGDWFEAYAASMELNVWTSTTIQGKPSFDPKTKTWTVHLKRADGSERVIHPHHVILASGHSGEPRVPKFPGAETFKGDIHHSSQHPEGSKYAGKRAVIVGCCNSAHDIAQDLYEHGAESVTMVQRSSTYVLSSEMVLKYVTTPLYVENGPPTETADLLNASIPLPVLKVGQQNTTKVIAEEDKEKLDKLRKAGFKLDYGYEGSGLIMKYFTAGGGYYIDVGCSKLIGDGKIKIKQGKQISKIVEDGIVFEDGSKLEADLIVLATGYDNMRQTARKVFGDELADRVTDVWGLNEEGEIATIWQKSGFPNFWFMGGNLALARIYSRFLALQIKAAELGWN